MNKLAVNIEEKFFGESSGAPLTKLEDIGSLVSIIVNAAFVLAGIILLFFFIFGGISMIAGAGKDNPEQAAKGKQAITSAVLGFIVVFASYPGLRMLRILALGYTEKCHCRGTCFIRA